MPLVRSGEILDIRGTLDTSNAEAFTPGEGAFGRTALQQEPLTVYTVPVTDLRVWDDFNLLLPGTAASDDLAVIEGTLGTDAVRVQSSDAGGTTVTQYARFHFVLPPEYDGANDIRVRLRASMKTTVSDGTATVDVQAYLHDDDGAVGSDLCTTAAQSINSLTKANKDFVITATGIGGGDTLDIRVAISITDVGDAGVMLGEISQIAMLLDIRG